MPSSTAWAVVAGVCTRTFSTMRPDGSTAPAAILVPPTSTPIVKSTCPPSCSCRSRSLPHAPSLPSVRVVDALHVDRLDVDALDVDPLGVDPLTVARLLPGRRGPARADDAADQAADGRREIDDGAGEPVERLGVGLPQVGDAPADGAVPALRPAVPAL